MNFFVFVWVYKKHHFLHFEKQNNFLFFWFFFFKRIERIKRLLLQNIIKGKINFNFTLILKTIQLFATNYLFLISSSSLNFNFQSLNTKYSLCKVKITVLMKKRPTKYPPKNNGSGFPVFMIWKKYRLIAKLLGIWPLL